MLENALQEEAVVLCAEKDCIKYWCHYPRWWLAGCELGTSRLAECGPSACGLAGCEPTMSRLAGSGPSTCGLAGPRKAGSRYL